MLTCVPCDHYRFFRRNLAPYLSYVLVILVWQLHTQMVRTLRRRKLACGACALSRRPWTRWHASPRVTLTSALSSTHTTRLSSSSSHWRWCHVNHHSCTRSSSLHCGSRILRVCGTPIWACHSPWHALRSSGFKSRMQGHTKAERPKDPKGKGGGGCKSKAVSGGGERCATYITYDATWRRFSVVDKHANRHQGTDTRKANWGTPRREPRGSSYDYLTARTIETRNGMSRWRTTLHFTARQGTNLSARAAPRRWRWNRLDQMRILSRPSEETSKDAVLEPTAAWSLSAARMHGSFPLRLTPSGHVRP